MGVERMTVYRLACDGCGESCGMEGGELVMLDEDPVALTKDARAEWDWTTDGEGRWHCTSCEPLGSNDDLLPPIPGQLSIETGPVSGGGL